TWTSEAERAALRAGVGSGALDGYLWATDETLAERRVIYGSRGTADLIELSALKGAVGYAILKRSLKAQGGSPEGLDELLRPVRLETVRVEQGRESRWSGKGLFIMTVLLVTTLYGIVLMYGVILMRSVLEEKASRVVEVLLSAATARQLMAGKILGVGAVGLTQMAIWAFMGFAVVFPALPLGEEAALQVPTLSLVFFPVFFALGYLLYAGLWAMLAAVMNSEQEAYQLQTLVMLPLLISIVLVFFLIRRPDSPMAIWLSLVPFFSPLLMYVRILVQTPPAWQIALSLALLAGSAWYLLVLCARIYQVGILLYGKRPTLAEVWKWMRYA
ncbi:MAG: ABC transporter permease, partial [Terriglobales bacterium]